MMSALQMWSIEDKAAPYVLEAVLEALTLAGGNISQAARLLGRPRTKVKAYIDKTQEALQKLDDLRQEMLDKAEENFAVAVHEGDLKASAFVLKTIGKDRGYVQRVEATGANGKPLDTRQMSDAELQKYLQTPDEEE